MTVVSSHYPERAHVVLVCHCLPRKDQAQLSLQYAESLFENLSRSAAFVFQKEVEIEQKILRDAEKSLTEYTIYKTSPRHCETFGPLFK